jgi:hypothetical protein
MQLLQWTTNILVLRLLTPVDYGVMATQLYDRREDRVTLDEVVKINIRGRPPATGKRRLSDLLHELTLVQRLPGPTSPCHRCGVVLEICGCYNFYLGMPPVTVFARP